MKRLQLRSIFIGRWLDKRSVGSSVSLSSIASQSVEGVGSVDTAEHVLGESKVQKAKRLRRELLNTTTIEGSLIKETLQKMENDESFKLTTARLKELGQEKLSREERTARRRALDDIGVKSFSSFLKERNVPELTRRTTEVFQMNIGLYCNQACSHCHVESSPRRKEEQMSLETIDRCLQLIARSKSITTVDITGGAPELHEHFRYLIKEAVKLGKTVIDRCNLTVLLEPGLEDLADFLAENKVHVIASLPCYGEKNVDLQRGTNVFKRSILGLTKLNERGYGAGGDLTLDLVYNPLGAFLPPDQKALEKQYKEKLGSEFGIVFDNLFTLTNMPIKRFADHLVKRGELKDYMQLLVNKFNAKACDNVMCSTYVSVDHEGNLFDCDFNQQLKMTLKTKTNTNLTVRDIESVEDLLVKKILTSNHCFGCVSGQGSSCQGATT